MCACVCLRVLACGCVILGVSYIVIAPSVGAFPGKVFVMSVSPGDVVSTSVGVLHVQSVVQTVVMERSREVVSFALSGVDGRGWVHSNMPIGEGMVPLAVDVSESEALVWFDRERRLRRLGDAVFSPGDSAVALGRLMPERVALVVWVTVKGLFMILTGVVFICGLRLVAMTFGWLIIL